MEVISLKESNRLIQLEKVIKDGQQAFIEVGTALAVIRDEKLYRADYKSFAEYLDQVWQLGRAHGYRLIDASEAAKCLTNETKAKVNLAAATALSKVPPPKRHGIVSKIVSAGQKVTAAAVSKMAPKPPRKSTTQLLDGTGLEIPPEALSLWNRSGEAQALLSKISEIRGVVKRAQGYEGDICPNCAKVSKSGNIERNRSGCSSCNNGMVNIIDPDILFAEVDFTDDLAHLNQLYLDLQRAKPYAVCPSCDGIKPDGCLTCKGRGWLSEFYWTHNIPQETKDLTGRK